MPTGLSTFGKTDWADYTDYWREVDAEWLQDRSVLRYATAAARNADYPTPAYGQVTYREDALGANIDRLEMYSKQHAAWVPLLMLANITSTQDTTAGVALSHKLASGKGIVFQPALTVMDNPVSVTAAFTALTANIAGGVLTADGTGVTIKVGTKTAKLTTDATYLLSDTALKAPTLDLTGGTLSAPNAAGSLLSLAVTNVLTAGVNSSISGFAFKSGYIHHTTNGGLQSTNGFFHGQSDSALMRYRDGSSLALGSSYVQVTSGNVNVVGGGCYMSSLLRIQGSQQGIYHEASGKYFAPSFYQTGSTPDASPFPDGTLWIS